jgi:hypothetical protein
MPGFSRLDSGLKFDNYANCGMLKECNQNYWKRHVPASGRMVSGLAGVPGLKRQRTAAPAKRARSDSYQPLFRQ